LEPLITAGIQQGDFLVISKTDIASPEELAEATAATRAINPDAPLYCLTLGGELPPDLVPELLA
jgi:G3E family GTPase